ncbi:MAG: hypothetical protein BAJATHORv1_10122 [Candidatus Thorarchaeota archaeon]|nr:MAG: hypothetical protein BAJATHORv1_10122 [Candidatus Thorarchaeota archaeon]
MSKTRRLLLEFETEEVGKQARSNSEVRKELVRAISDSSDIVRQRALLATIDLADPTVVDDVTKAMKDDEEEVRIAAAQSLAFYHQPKTIPILLEGLKDSDPWVRSHCAKGLSKLIHGPLWARLPEEDIDKILSDFPGMVEEDIRQYLTELKLEPEAIDSLMKWKRKDYEIDIDPSRLEEEMLSKPIIFESEKITDKTRPMTQADEIASILSELPRDVLSTLPPEDLKRLTPKTARQLVDSLKESFPTETEPEEEVRRKKKDTGKVRKVRKVQRVKKKSAREEMLAKLPDEVKESMPPEVLENISVEELEALLNMTADSEGVAVDVPEEKVEEKKPKKVKKKVVKRVKKRKKKKSPQLEDIAGIGPATVESLKAAGFNSVQMLSEAKPEELIEKVVGVGSASAEKMIADAKILVSGEEEKTKPEKKGRKEKMLAKLPAEVRESMGKEAIDAMTEEEVEMLISSLGTIETEAPVTPEKSVDSKMDILVEKYGREKAEILALIPDDMLASIPEDQIKEMDIPTLKSLSQAFEHT